MRYRIGIDVGGTFTKAAVVDARTRAVVARRSVPTTHGHAHGVAAGVVEVFRLALEEAGVSPGDVVFLAHSTTQATNALLEGDVIPVGVVGLASRVTAPLARTRFQVAPIELAPGRSLVVHHRFLVSDDLAEADVDAAIEGLRAEGAAVIVASAAFGVDDTGAEAMVRDRAVALGMAATCGHEITRLYGFEVRTRTAALNASILPRMIAVADMTARGVREAGALAPVMVMRSDGGVVDIAEMRRRPALTMLSGPAASIAGAVVHLGARDGVYFEVGGTSTNLAVIKGGLPHVTHARVGGHETMVKSVDVRVLAIGGGSLVQARPGALLGVGPRSAHIAGLPYCAFTALAPGEEPRVGMFEPMPGDGDTYVALETSLGRRLALTPTCAANALGAVGPGEHCHGDQASARRGFEALGAFLGHDAEAAARGVLALAADKIVPVIRALVAEYELTEAECALIGVGGGAGALVPQVAAALGLPFTIAPDAEIIASVGAALAMIREVVERVIPHPTEDDLARLGMEARDAAERGGAVRDTIDVVLWTDMTTGVVRAVATGSAHATRAASAR